MECKQPTSRKIGLPWVVLSQPRNLQPGSPASPRASPTQALGRNDIHMVISPKDKETGKDGHWQTSEAVSSAFQIGWLAVPKEQTQW